MTRTTWLVVAAIAAALMIGPSVAAKPSAIARPAPELADATATGHRLANRYFKLLRDKNVEGLQAFLSPAFQVQRADGSSSEKEDFLAKLPVVNNFVLTDFRATQAGSTLIVRYLASVEGLINGRPYTPGPAPRLATYAWNGSRWQIAANANFNPLKG
jgi:hypothetical protein